MALLDTASLLRAGFTGDLVLPSAAEYERAISRWSAAAVKRAALVAYPRTAADVAHIIAFARTATPPLELAIVCGGHNASGSSSTDGGVVT